MIDLQQEETEKILRQYSKRGSNPKQEEEKEEQSFFQTAIGKFKQKIFGEEQTGSDQMEYEDEQDSEEQQDELN